MVKTVKVTSCVFYHHKDTVSAPACQGRLGVRSTATRLSVPQVVQN